MGSRMYGDEFEALDVVDETMLVPTVEVVYGGIHKVYIDKDRYDYDMRAGLEDEQSVRAQLDKDIPRCELYCDNVRTWTLDKTALPIDMLRYCTQAVLALPMTMVANQVVEYNDRNTSRPMIVHASSDAIHVQKRMQVLVSEDIWTSVLIGVFVHKNDQSVVLTFEFGPQRTTRHYVPIVPRACTKKKKARRRYLSELVVF